MRQAKAIIVALIAVAASGTACGRSSVEKAAAAPQSTAPLPKNERAGTWQAPAGGEQRPLWPAAFPLARPDSGDRPEATGNGTGLVGGRMWHWASYVTRPTMTVFRPRTHNGGAAMLVIPGGGFEVVATDLEGTEVCDWVVRQGMTCAMLKYRVPQVWPQLDGHQQRPAVLLGLEDAQRAMTLLRHDAARYGIDPNRVGAIGFSAGAYLVAAMSNTAARTYTASDAADRQSSRPDFAIVAYTARMLDNSKGRNSLELRPWVKIDPHAPPTLIIHAMDDPTDGVRQPMAYALALTDAGVPVDMRLYARGGHAFGLRPTSAPVTTEWPKDAERWLRDIGVLR